MRIGLIGCGYWGKNYAKTLPNLEAASLDYICDSEQIDPKIALLGKKFVKDYREILDDKEIKAVIIATPTETHYEVAKNALEAGKHVLVEKPMTATSKQARGLVNVAEKSNRTLMVGHIFMYNPAVQELKKRIDAGELGRVLSMNANRLALGPVRYADNALWDLAPHDISMFTYLSNSKPESVLVSGSAPLGRNIEDVISLSLGFEDKTMATLTAGWIYSHKIRDLVVVGDKKMAYFDDMATDRLAIYDKGIDADNGNSLSYRDGDTLLPKISNASPLEAQCNHFFDCIRSKVQPLSDGKNGEQVVRILEAGQKSLEDKQKGVELND